MGRDTRQGPPPRGHRAEDWGLCQNVLSTKAVSHICMDSAHWPQLWTWEPLTRGHVFALLKA